MQVAIIGGGVGGLAVAYNLIKNWPTSQGVPPIVTVYEANNRFGGNADTVFFDLAPGLTRWADLGVNDFNLPAYTQIVDVMNTIGFTGYAPLEDSTCYYTLDGSIVYANDQPQYVPNQMPQELVTALEAFMVQATADYGNVAYADYTIKEYVETVFSQNKAYDPRIGPQVIYPRINGMYFNDEVAPAHLPFVAVMHYYIIQENGDQTPERMYFVDGCSAWIDALTTYMTSMGIVLVGGYTASLQYVDGAWKLYNTLGGTTTTGTPQTPDIVVMATHADDAIKILGGGASTQVMNCLGRVRYLNGLSVAHTFTGTLPPDYNGWCTYNILIHQPSTALKPYTITYVCNRHQNDRANPEYDYFGAPQFFITVNPPVPIPEQHVLLDNVTNKPAIANLRHNVFDFNCLSAQTEIAGLQGQNSLYFAGGWTIGAGLHEECWIQGQTIASQIITGIGSNDHVYDRSKPSGAYAPAYMRRLTRR